MRRLVLVCLLLILPVLWSWAATASVCRHQGGCATQHLALHGAEHAVADGLADDAVGDASGAAADRACDADCSCQGQGLVALIGRPAALASAAGSAGASGYVRHVPDHVPDDPLRPPSVPFA